MPKIIPIILCSFLFSMITPASLEAQADPGTEFDLQGFINGKIDAGETEIIVPPGRYRIAPTGNNSYHLRFDNLNNITILGEGVEIICTETVQAIQINNCVDFKLKGFSVDYDPLPFTQGQITEISADKRTITASIIDGYSSTVKGSKLEIYDSISGDLVTSTYYGITYQVDEPQRIVTVTKPSNYQADNSFEEIGDIVVLESQNTRKIPHAIVPVGCTNLVLEDIILYSGTTFGFFERDCSASTYLNCIIDRRPLEDEVIERGMRRMRSINADGFHSKHATTGPSYIGCVARYNGDDGIAINGNYHVITSAVGKVLTVVGKGGETPNLEVGDTAELVSYTGVRIEDAVITTISKGPALSSEEKTFLQNYNFLAEAGNTYKASNVYFVKLDRSVDLPLGSLIASTNRIGNGFKVENCTIGPNRSRGILVKSSNGNISNNTLVDNWGHAIKLAPEYVWLEAGSGSNVVISNNEITRCHAAGIAVYANGGNGATAPAGAHQNITITGNTISGSANPAIALTSISGLELENNTITDPDNSLLVPWILSQFGRNEDPSRQIYMKNVIADPPVTSIQPKEAINQEILKINQNPFSDFLVLEHTGSKPVDFTIYSILGAKMLQGSTALRSEISTAHWQKGVYILVVKNMVPLKLLKQ